MTKLPIAICALLTAATASAQPREAWIRRCQAGDAELAGSTGYRVCTELYDVTEHCRAAQAMFGTGHTSGDAVPSCMAGEFDLRNRQLGRILQGDYAR